ncbi:MAG TPA: hypothetical protein VM733_08940 [Thermoanaerobaculia bacterium]|nr:hypothetical protein [Thermoanaerobaculia bacterium]
MSEYRFEAEIILGDTVPDELVRERAYDGVRVVATWPQALEPPVIRAPIAVRGDVDRRDAPAYVELFIHDLFLLLNLASPGSFGGTITVTGNELRVRELTFDPRVFAYAAPFATLRLADVVRWYDSLRLGAQQIAPGGVATALVQLLHLARSPERDDESILRLAIAAEAVVEKKRIPPRLLALRNDIAHGRVASIHPMHDDALDPRAEDATREWIEVADAAACLIIGALQERIRGQ